MIRRPYAALLMLLLCGCAESPTITTVQFPGIGNPIYVSNVGVYRHHPYRGRWGRRHHRIRRPYT